MVGFEKENEKKKKKKKRKRGNSKKEKEGGGRGKKGGEPNRNPERKIEKCNYKKIIKLDFFVFTILIFLKRSSARTMDKNLKSAKK